MRKNLRITGLYLVLTLGSWQATGMEAPGHESSSDEETSAKEYSPEEAEQGRKLIQAVKDEDMDLIYALIDATPAIINYQDPETGNTPLLEAVEDSNRPIIKLLLQKGADPLIKNAQGFPPIFIILQKWSEREELLRLLISYNIQARDAPGPNGQTALQYAVEHDLPEKRVLLNLWADINAQDDRGWTALHYAVAQCDSITVDFLLEKGANPNIKSFDSDGNRTADMVINCARAGRRAPDIVGAVQRAQLSYGKGWFSSLKSFIGL